MESPEKTDRPGYAARPGWVKWLVIAGLVAVLVVTIALLAGGEHGPGRHLSGATYSGGGAVKAVAAVRI